MDSEMNVDEAYDLAFKYAKGLEGYPVDKVKSAYYLKIAADQGHVKAMNNLAVALDRGDGVPKDREAAAKYYKLAADQGHTVAQANYGFMLLKGKGVEQNKEEALRYFEKAADDGYTKVLSSIVQLFDEGIFDSFAEQLKYYKMAADNGIEDAMLSVVILLEDAETYELKKDKAELIKYSKMLAEKGNKRGLYDYAKLIIDFTIDKDEEDLDLHYPETEECEKAVEYCKQSAEMGNRDAMALYGRCLYYGIYIEKDEEEGLRYILKSFEDEDEASDQGYVIYGTILFNGDGVEKNVAKAAEYFEKAAKYDRDGMYWYVKLMMDKEIEEVPFDLDKAVYSSRRGAERGEGHCMYYYALFLFDGNGVEQDREEAIQWIKKAQNKYIVEADYLLYRVIRAGLYSPKKGDLNSYLLDEDDDLDEYLDDDAKLKYMDYLLSSAAICDIKDSYYQYGYNNERGIGKEQDYEMALKYYEEGSMAGDPKCMVRYGLMAELGRGMDKDPEIATEYYKMAVDLEFWDGYYNYATMLNAGLGIEMNQEEAAKYFEYAKDYHKNDAVFRYGVDLLNGIGVDKDEYEACHLFKQAAVQGDKNGMFFYGFMRFNGKGYKKDIKEGLKYIIMAAQKGNQQAQDYLDKFC